MCFLLKVIDQSRLNYEEQNQYKIRIQFSNQSQLIEEDFFIYIQDINESPYNLQCSSRNSKIHRGKQKEIDLFLLFRSNRFLYGVR